jgi:hypothetical protein
MVYHLKAVLAILKIFDTTEIEKQTTCTQKIKGFPEYSDFYFGKNTNIEAHIVSLPPTRLSQQG